jgi:CRP-like cAMP-binding protein
MRLNVDMLGKCVTAPGPMKDLLNKSVHALFTQIAQSGICNRFHSVDARLARWLLMTRDRIGSRTLLATQETIARILGVRRSSVTDSASTFQQRKIIDYSRGRIDIIDQRRLLGSSCTCYGIIKRQYDSFLR